VVLVVRGIHGDLRDGRLDHSRRFFGGGMARVFGLIFGALLVFVVVPFALATPPTAVVQADEPTAFSVCSQWIAWDQANDGGQYTAYNCSFNGGHALAVAGGGCSSGLYTLNEYDENRTAKANGQVFTRIRYFQWCVPADCSQYSSGYSTQNWNADIADGDVRCSDGCMSVFHNTGAFNLCFSGGGSCSSTTLRGR